MIFRLVIVNNEFITYQTKPKKEKKKKKPNYYLILGLETMLLVNCNDGYKMNYAGN
jgi:hypothetical protein